MPSPPFAFEVTEVARQFALGGELFGVSPVVGGHINRSYRVEVTREKGPVAFLLQRLNPRVFPRPDLVMENIGRVTRHLASKLQTAGFRDWDRRALSLVPTLNGADWHREADGAGWRMYRFIGQARTLLRAAKPAHARDAGRAFGRFLANLADYHGPALHQTIPGFHDTAARFRQLDDAVRQDPKGRAGAVGTELAALQARRPWSDLLPPLVASRDVPVRLAHNDAKIANVLFDEATGAPLCVVDLDTVMPGSVLHDFGDLVRSTVSPTDEDERDLTRVGVRPELYTALQQGFLETAGGMLTPRERELLHFAGKLITLEQAVRFLTDYINGDTYYRVEREGQNLDRARAQLKLVESLELLE